MIFFRSFLLCCIMLINLPTALASDKSPSITEALIIKSNYKIPDYSNEWQKYLSYLERLNAEAITLENKLKNHTNQGLKNGLTFNVAALRRRLKNTANEVRFYRNYKRHISAWHRHIKQRSHHITSQALAWGLRQQNLPHADGLGLYFMSMASFRDGELVAALNQAHIALKLPLPKADHHALVRLYDQWLENATLRAGDPVYNLSAQPISACIAFAYPLAKTQPLPLDDYIRAENGKKLATSIKGRNICVSGLNYGEEFSLTLRRGLMAENGAILGRDTKRLIQVSDRKPNIRFNSNKWLAPLTGDEMIAAYAVNLDSADLSLYRIGERGLRRALLEGGFEQNIRFYKKENLKNNLGEAVWQGKVTLAKEKNQEVTTLIPVRKMLKSMKPGLYVIAANWDRGDDGDNYRWRQNYPLQWILFSDTGLTALKGSDGLTIISREISTAKIKSGVSLKLIAANNEILGHATSDKNGITRFPAGLLRGEGGNRPSHLIADDGKGDFTLLRLNDDTLDLSNFDIAGRTAPTTGDMYLFTERSVYRAGEKVYLSGFLRDKNAHAISGRRLELRLLRPDGIEDRKVTLKGDDLGAYAYDINLSPTARTGRWSFLISYSGEDTALARTSFEIQDFVPLRLKAELVTDSKIAKKSEKLNLTLSADFLYGASASGLSSQIRATLRATSSPFPDYAKYHFGLLGDNFSTLTLLDKKGKLSAQGKQSLSLMVEKEIDTTKPLEIVTTATVFDVGGRPAMTVKRLPYRHEDVSVGLYMGDITSNGEEGSAEAHMVSLNADGTPSKNRNLRLRWIKEDHDYQWYQRSGYWRSKTVIYDTLMAETDGRTDEKGLLQINRRLPNGSYRLEVAHKDGTSQASIRFHVGWWSQNKQANEPDQLDLKLSTTSLNSGDRLRGQIKAPFNGKVSLMVVSDHVHYIRALNLVKGVADFNVKIGKNWGTGAYIMATAFRPTGDNQAGDNPIPVRATNFAWFDINHDKRHLGVTLMAPETVLPRKKATIPLKISGLEKGEKARVTLLAVDEGILRLMAFKSPSLSDHFMGKRALGTRLYDIYGRLLLGEKGRRGSLNTGGDFAAERMMTMSKPAKMQQNRAGLTTRVRRAVALVSRDVTVDNNGQAQITWDMPDFVGQLRLMAVAYSADKMGQAEAPLIVRDPIAADLILPRFMAPADQAKPVISLQNLSGKTQSLTLSLEAEGPVTTKMKSEGQITLKDQERLEIPVLITATGVGVARFKLTVTGGMAPIERTWNMAVRAPYAYESRTHGQMLAAGANITITPEGANVGRNEFLVGSTQTSVMISNAPDLKIDKMLGDLALYRYLCTEQTVSRAMPMLYADRLVAAGLSDKDQHSYAAQIDQAIERLLMRQNRGGDFGLWRAYDDGNDWASLYAIDFLMQAKEVGYHVPDGALKRAIHWIGLFQAGQNHHIFMSYGLYLRARAGDAMRGDIRHYAVTTEKSTTSPLAEAYLGAALALVGENDLAEERFRQALTTEWTRHRSKNFYDYGSLLRDRAAAITLLAESGITTDLLFEAGTELERLTSQQNWFNTQQQAWLVRAASVLSGDQALSLSVNGKALEKLKASWAQNIDKDLTVTNRGTHPVRATQTIRGIPAVAPKPMQNGATITRRYLDLSGKSIDQKNIRQNDRFIVLITGETHRIGTEASLVIDLLPAGLEIENAKVGGDSQLNQYKFLPTLTRARYSSELDDRYYAVLDNRHQGRFAFAYMVRAVTTGTYIQPPVMIEDMYQPQYRAIGVTGSVQIFGANE